MTKLSEHNYCNVNDDFLQFAGAVSTKGNEKHGAKAIKCLAYVLTLYQLGETFIKEGEQDIEKQRFLNDVAFKKLIDCDGHYVVKCELDDLHKQITQSKDNTKRPCRKRQDIDIVGEIICAGMVKEKNSDGTYNHYVAITASYTKDNDVYFKLNPDVMHMFMTGSFGKCNLFNLFSIKNRYACMLYLILTKNQDLFIKENYGLMPRKSEVIYEKLSIKPDDPHRTNLLDNAIKELNDVIGLGITLEKKRINEDSKSDNAKIGEFIFHVEHPELLAPKKLSKKPTHNTNRANISKRNNYNDANKPKLDYKVMAEPKDYVEGRGVDSGVEF